MIQVVAIHMEGVEHLQHIATLRWVEVDQPGIAWKTQPQDISRAGMVDFVRKNPSVAFAINATGGTFAYLEVVEATPAYVKTMPDGTRSDNLLTLPRF